MKISVAICTYNRQKLLSKCINSLLNQDFEKSNYEIIIIDNNSSDGTKDLVYEFIEKNKDFNIRYVFEPVQGLSVSRNRAIAEAKSDILLFIDDDAIADKSLLKEHLRIYREFENVGCVGGKILLEFIDGKPDWLDEKFYKFYGYLDVSDKILEIRHSPYGGNISFNLEIIKKENLRFDNLLGRKGNILRSGEEVILVENLIKRKYKVFYNPNAFIYHIISADRVKYRYLIRNIKNNFDTYFYVLNTIENRSKLYIFFLGLYNACIYLISLLKNIFFLKKSNIFYILLYLIGFLNLLKRTLHISKGDINET